MNAPFNLVEELERLKAENSALRKDTIHLLKAKQAWFIVSFIVYLLLTQ